MKVFINILLMVLYFAPPLYSQSNDFETKNKLLAFIKGKDSLIDHVFENNKKYNLEIIYGEINNHTNDSVEINNIKLFENESYFYPASSIKLPCAILALEKLNQLEIPKAHYFRIKDEFICGNMAHIHNSNSKKSSYFDIIKLMLAVSDNPAYNSVYEFLTPKYIHQQLSNRNLNNISIYKKFAGCNIVENLKFNPISFYDTNNNLINEQKSSILELSEMAEKYKFSPKKLIGEHYKINRKIIDKPFDFNYNLEASLMDLHHCLTRLVFPNSISKNLRWEIKENDRLFLLKSLGLFPRELELSSFQDTTKYPDDLLKYIAFGNSNKKEKNNIRTIGKIGISYGFVTETSIVLDFNNNTSFFLSVRMHVNENNILNDNIYQYETIAKPFLGKLGQIISEYQKINSYEKDLSDFKVLFN